MNKFSLFIIFKMHVVALILFLSVIAQFASAQAVKDATVSLPAEIDKIVQRSCIGCHKTDGKFFARIKINFEEWSNYSSAQQAQKSSLMCSMLKKEKMPPKAERKANPDRIPTGDEISRICDWSENLKSNIKK